ncbi:hypothetical protein TPENAI_40055 [Tenacibaculum litopenaei]
MLTYAEGEIIAYTLSIVKYNKKKFSRSSVNIACGEYSFSKVVKQDALNIPELMLELDEGNGLLPSEFLIFTEIDKNQRLSSILVSGIPEYIENHILINTSK